MAFFCAARNSRGVLLRSVGIQPARRFSLAAPAIIRGPVIKEIRAYVVPVRRLRFEFPSLLDTHTVHYCRIPRLGQTTIAIKAIIGSLMTPYRIR